MKVNSLDKNSISFNGFYNSKSLKSVLSFAENNGALFTTATALTLSTILRPPSIMAAPKTDKENKKIACAKAITSTILDFIITFAISVPFVKAVSNINKNPQNYLKPETIENLKNGADSLKNSKSYNLASQIFKLGIGIAIAAPKALLNLFGMPYIMNAFFEKEQPNNTEGLIFRGKGTDKMSSWIGKIMDKKLVQDFSIKNADSNFPMHINAIKDALTTGVFVAGLSKSKKVDETRKDPLIYNSLTATALSIVSGYIIDSLTDKSAEKFIKKLSEANKNDPELKRYINGFKIAKPAIILGVMYYGIIPFISTYLGDRISLKRNEKIKPEKTL